MQPARLGYHEFSNSGASGSLEVAESELTDGRKIELLSVSYNQEYSCFSAGTSHGFGIYSCEPKFKDFKRRDLKSGAFRIVHMWLRFGVLALVGDATNSEFPPNKVVIWDDKERQKLFDFSFKSDVHAVKRVRHYIVVALECKICIFNFISRLLLDWNDTLMNPKGLCCLSYYLNHSYTHVLACLGLRQGEVLIKFFGIDPIRKTHFISAHESHRACMTLTMDGLLLATASVKGTSIRIFNTLDIGTRAYKRYTVRTGLDMAEIYSIALTPSVEWLALSSDKGSV
ncbi:hypothetical protein ACFE04_017129 [Oxalis oulophora]